MANLVQSVDLSALESTMDLSTVFDSTSFPQAGLGFDIPFNFGHSATPLPPTVFVPSAPATPSVYAVNSPPTPSSNIALENERQKLLLAQNEIHRLSRATASLMQANAVLRAEKAQIEQDHRKLLEAIGEQLKPVARQPKFVRPLREDHNVKIWAESDYKEYREGVDKFHPPPLRIDDVPVWLQDSNGQTVKKARYRAIRAVMQRSFFDLLRKGKAASVFTELGQEATLDLFDDVYPTAPELLYCDNDWKIHTLGVSMYSDWRRTHVPSTKEVKEERAETPVLVPRGKHPISEQQTDERPAKKIKVVEGKGTTPISVTPTPTVTASFPVPTPPPSGPAPPSSLVPPAHTRVRDAHPDGHKPAVPRERAAANSNTKLKDPLDSVVIRPGRSANELNPQQAPRTPEAPLQQSKPSPPGQQSTSTSGPSLDADVPAPSSNCTKPATPPIGTGKGQTDAPGNETSHSPVLPAIPSAVEAGLAPAPEPNMLPAGAPASPSQSNLALPAQPVMLTGKAALPAATPSLLALGELTAMQLQSGTIAHVPESAADAKKKPKKTKATKTPGSTTKSANASTGFKWPPADTTKPKELCKLAWAAGQESEGVQLGRADNARFDKYWKSLSDDQTKEWRKLGLAKRKATKAAAGAGGPSETMGTGSDDDMDVNEDTVPPNETRV